MRPRITLSYAQSLDGSIAVAAGQRTTISGAEAMRMTHALRAEHDAILVGIGTVIADNPRLNVRLVQGRSPQPVVLDSHLRMPLSAALIQAPTHPLWLFCSTAANVNQRLALENAGASVFISATEPTTDSTAQHIALVPMLHTLYNRGIDSVMVEGGASIIQAFLAARLVDKVVITIAPRFLDGLPAITGKLLHPPNLIHPRYQTLGQDVVLQAEVIWQC